MNPRVKSIAILSMGFLGPALVLVIGLFLATLLAKGQSTALPYSPYARPDLLGTVSHILVEGEMGTGGSGPIIIPTPPLAHPTPGASTGHASILPWAFHITSEFGHYPNGNPHYGLDLDATFGVVQTAPVGGVVEDVLRGCVQGDETCGRGWGNHVWWQSSETGHHILLAHFEKLEDWVQVGATVTAGQAIGVTGATGYASGPHVHVQVNTDQCCTNISAISPATEFPWLACDPTQVLGNRFGGPCP